MTTLPNRRSHRLPTFDYAQPGAYYVTFVRLGRRCDLGRIDTREFFALEAGEIVTNVWRNLPNRFTNLTLDVFQLMPNHLHGVFFLGSIDALDWLAPNTTFTYAAPDVFRSVTRGTSPGSLSAVVQNVSSTTCRLVNRSRGTPGQRLWQERPHDRVIRDARELERIREYIVTNPARRDEDEENPDGRATR